MQGKRRFSRLIFPLIIICLGACSSPIGTIGGHTVNDGLFAVTRRVSYTVNEAFDRNRDVQVFVSYRGNVREINVEDVLFSLIKNPQQQDELTPLYEDGQDVGYFFDQQGMMIITVEYEGMETRYWIEVDDPLNQGGGGGGQSDNGSGITIQWAR